MQTFRTRRDHAQGVVEYGLFLSLASLAAIGSLTYFGEVVSSLVSKLSGNV